MVGKRNKTDDVRIEGDETEQRESLARRHLLRIGGIAAAGAGAAAIASAMNASPAAATTANMQYGGANFAGTDPTALFADVGPGVGGSAAVLSVFDEDLTPADASIALFADSTAGSAVFAVSEDGTSAAVFATHGGSGPAVEATDAESAASGFGTGSAIKAHLDNPSNASDAITVAHSGTGKGVNVTTGAGTAVVAVAGAGTALSAASATGGGIAVVLTDAANTHAAVSASSGGKGSALTALTGSNATNPAVQSTSGSALPAVQATGKTVSAGGAVAAAGNAAALSVQGVASFTRSNVATVPAGAKSVLVSVPGGLTAASHVLATMQTTTAATVGVKSATPHATTGKITITLTAAAPAGGIRVAWFVFG